VRINSPGGSVPDGLAIYNALRRHGARIVVTVDGQAASIASLIVQAGDERLMPENTIQMVHGPSTFCGGNAVEMRQCADMLDTWATAMKANYLAKAPDKADELQTMLTDGNDHYFTAEEAVAFGIADKVIKTAVDDVPDEAAAAAALLGYVTSISSAPAAVQACLRMRIAASVTDNVFASLPEASQRAVIAHIEDPIMRKNLHTIMAAAVAAAAAAPSTTPAPSPSPAPAAAAAPPAPVAAAPAPTPLPVAATEGDIHRRARAAQRTDPRRVRRFRRCAGCARP
jgi:hypothetical protein